MLASDCKKRFCPKGDLSGWWHAQQEQRKRKRLFVAIIYNTLPFTCHYTLWRKEKQFQTVTYDVLLLLMGLVSNVGQHPYKS